MSIQWLFDVIQDRKINPDEKSYTTSLFVEGLPKIAQKVGEEAVELVIEAKDDDPARFRSEAADLLFHYLVLLRAKDLSIINVIADLKTRRK